MIDESCGISESNPVISNSYKLSHLCNINTSINLSLDKSAKFPCHKKIKTTFYKKSQILKSVALINSFYPIDTNSKRAEFNRKPNFSEFFTNRQVMCKSGPPPSPLGGGECPPPALGLRTVIKNAKINPMGGRGGLNSIKGKAELTNNGTISKPMSNDQPPTSVAFFSNAVKLKVNNSLCCGHETLSREPCQNKPVVPAPASSAAYEKVLKKLPKKVIKTSKGKNPPHISNSTKDFANEKEPGGGGG